MLDVDSYEAITQSSQSTTIDVGKHSFLLVSDVSVRPPAQQHGRKSILHRAVSAAKNLRNSTKCLLEIPASDSFRECLRPGFWYQARQREIFVDNSAQTIYERLLCQELTIFWLLRNMPVKATNSLLSKEKKFC
jgi:hypothetical protein